MLQGMWPKHRPVSSLLQQAHPFRTAAMICRFERA
jgi:hypothetical protein